MSQAKRPRRAVTHGYARGDETRQRIIDAAIKLFGEYGFDSASTRDIAAYANVNAPALQYYFENKEGVYRACAEYLAEDAWASFEPALRNAQEVLRANADTAALIDAFVRIQEAVAERLFAAQHARSQRLFFAREQSGNEPSIASEVFQRRLREPLNAACANLVARVSGKAPDDPLTLIRMITLHGQLLLFHLAPRSTLNLMGWQEIDPEKGALLKQIVHAQTRTLLQSWHDEHVKQSAAARARPAAAAKAKAKAPRRAPAGQAASKRTAKS